VNQIATDLSRANGYSARLGRILAPFRGKACRDTFSLPANPGCSADGHRSAQRIRNGAVRRDRSILGHRNRFIESIRHVVDSCQREENDLRNNHFGRALYRPFNDAVGRERRDPRDEPGQQQFNGISVCVPVEPWTNDQRCDSGSSVPGNYHRHDLWFGFPIRRID
jgi:hypothetical protein